jgi:hypothetical protein
MEMLFNFSFPFGNILSLQYVARSDERILSVVWGCSETNAPEAWSLQDQGAVIRVGRGPACCLLLGKRDRDTPPEPEDQLPGVGEQDVPYYYVQ